jgi:hypothetical protein
MTLDLEVLKELKEGGISDYRVECLLEYFEFFAVQLRFYV